jgi:hypothetical protein
MGRIEIMDSSLSTYVQPLASHARFPERLVVRDHTGTFHLWLGNGDLMSEIPAALASWIIERPEMLPLPLPRLWYDVETLPMAIEMYDSEWSVAD